MASSAIDTRNRFRSTHPARYVALDGCRWEYWSGGHGPRGLLLLGGQLTFGDTLHRLISAFEPGRRVISPSYPAGASALKVVDSLARLLDLEQLDTADVFGHGLGGGLAHVFVRRHKDRVNRVVLSGFGLCTPFRAAALRARADLFRLLPHASLKAHFQRRFERLADQAADLSHAAEVLDLSEELLARHTRESALSHLRLHAELFDPSMAGLLNAPSAVRALIVNDTEDSSVTRDEHLRLAQTYASHVMVQRTGAAKLIGLTASPELEHKLDTFFRTDRVPAQPQVA